MPAVAHEAAVSLALTVPLIEVGKFADLDPDESPPLQDGRNET